MNEAESLSIKEWLRELRLERLSLRLRHDRDFNEIIFEDSDL